MAALTNVVNVHQLTNTAGKVGTSPAYALTGTVTDRDKFSDQLTTGKQCWYCCSDKGVSPTQYEIGVGTYNAVGDLLTRTLILESSESDDSSVDWPASGSRDIVGGLPAMALNSFGDPDAVAGLMAQTTPMVFNRVTLKTSTPNGLISWGTTGDGSADPQPDDSQIDTDYLRKNLNNAIYSATSLVLPAAVSSFFDFKGSGAGNDAFLRIAGTLQDYELTTFKGGSEVSLLTGSAAEPDTNNADKLLNADYSAAGKTIWWDEAISGTNQVAAWYFILPFGAKQFIIMGDAEISTLNQAIPAGTPRTIEFAYPKTITTLLTAWGTGVEENDNNQTNASFKVFNGTTTPPALNLLTAIYARATADLSSNDTIVNSLGYVVIGLI